MASNTAAAVIGVTMLSSGGRVLEVAEKPKLGFSRNRFRALANMPTYMGARFTLPDP